MSFNDLLVLPFTMIYGRIVLPEAFMLASTDSNCFFITTSANVKTSLHPSLQRLVWPSHEAEDLFRPYTKWLSVYRSNKIQITLSAVLQIFLKLILFPCTGVELMLFLQADALKVYPGVFYIRMAAL